MAFSNGSLKQRKWNEKKNTHTLNTGDFLSSLRGNDLNKYKIYKQNCIENNMPFKLTRGFLSTLSTDAKARLKDVKKSLNEQSHIKTIKNLISINRELYQQSLPRDMPQEIKDICADNYMTNSADDIDPNRKVFPKDLIIDHNIPYHDRIMFPYGGNMRTLPERGELMPNDKDHPIHID